MRRRAHRREGAQSREAGGGGAGILPAAAGHLARVPNTGWQAGCLPHYSLSSSRTCAMLRLPRRFFARQSPGGRLNHHAMTQPVAPKISKWPFYLGDVLLLILATWIVYRSPEPFRAAPLFCLVASVAMGAWLCVTPFLREYRAAFQMAESGALATVVEKIKNLQAVSDQISVATAQWQILQEHSAKTALAAKEVGDRMGAEAKAFADFMQKANDNEKAHLRLEAEKLRRGEGEWLQAAVLMLDHVHALHLAGVRSGQPALMEQLASFQTACREAVRRLGLTAFEAKPDEPFNEKTHQLLEPDDKPPRHARVVETVAAGYTFQGQLVRNALVRVQPAAKSLPDDSAQLSFDAATEAEGLTNP